MKFLSLLLVLCFTTNIFAKTLQQSFEEYQYALTVEWDQKDQKFYQEKTDAFFKDLSVAMSAGDLEKEKLMAFAEDKISNKKALEAFKLKLQLLSPEASSAQIAQLITSSAKEFSSQGASWNGSAFMQNAGLVVILAFLVYSAIFSATHECVAYEETDEISCSQSIVGWDDDLDPIYSGNYTCDNERVCVDYKRK